MCALAQTLHRVRVSLSDSFKVEPISERTVVMLIRFFVLSCAFVAGCSVPPAAPTAPPVPSASDRLTDEKADGSCRYRCDAYGYSPGECYQGWQCATTCLRYVGTPDAPTACPSPSPSPATWRDALPAGALDLSAMPVIDSDNSIFHASIALRLTGNKNGSLALTCSSTIAGSEGEPGAQADAIIYDSSGEFLCTLYPGSITERVDGKFDTSAQVRLTVYDVHNRVTGVGWSTGTYGAPVPWQPTPADWPYRTPAN